MKSKSSRTEAGAQSYNTIARHFQQITFKLDVLKSSLPNKTPTCVGEGEPAPQEVEGAVGRVVHVARQRLEVALRGQPAHKLSGVGAELAVVQSVRAVGQRVQQGPVGHGELAHGVVARAQGSLVAGAGGGQVGLDGEQVGVL